MIKVDYIIVGLGLAGMAFSEQLEARNKSFVVFHNNEKGASRVAGGLYNPVILKRYSLPWQGVEQFDLAIPYFKELCEKLGIDAVESMPVKKIFSSAEDQNNWFEASDKPGLDRFIRPNVTRNDNDAINAPFNLGEVKETGKVDIKQLLNSYSDYLKSKSALREEEFDYEKIQFQTNCIQYQDIEARFIVFAEGYGVSKNPFFKALPLVGNKGEYITIKSPKLGLKSALKSSFFIIPLGDDLYKVGATFNWKDKDTQPSVSAQSEIVEKLKKVINCDFEIVDQEAGIRPTTGDRRPLLGVHPKYDRLVILNGLGTRGIMMSPFLAKILYEHLEEGKDLSADVNINRFTKKLL